MSISPARLAAFDILSKIELDHGFSSALLAQFETNLNEKDRSLCHELVLGTLRRQIYLDEITNKHSRGKRLDPVVRISLRLGLYQLKYLDRVPSYSAINESVELVRRAKKSSATGFVNAVLRRELREPAALTFADEPERISIETSHPRWLVERWIRQFGPIDTEKLAAANNEAPALAFRLTAKGRGETAIAKSFTFRRSSYVDECFFAPRITKELVELEKNGLIYFQDEASQLVAGAMEIAPDGSFLDVCAAPGSKTGAVAANGHGLIVAGDLRPSRIGDLRQNLAKQCVKGVSICQYDAESELPFADESFAVVLVDAPCTGTGTIRHNPEIRYRLKEEDFGELSNKQLRIVKNASKVLKCGGHLIYSTCSLERDENEGVVLGLLKDRGELRTKPPDVDERFYTSEGFARTFPQRDDMDGFFIAKIEKLGST